MIKLLKLLKIKISKIFKNPTILKGNTQKLDTICKNLTSKTHVFVVLNRKINPAKVSFANSFFP